MPFYSYWHQKQLVVMRPNACLTPFTTIIIHFWCMMIWEKFDSSWPACLVFFFLLSSFTECGYPVGIIGSINITLRHRVHSSFKKKKALGWSVWEMMKGRSEDCFYIYVIISPIILKWKVQCCSEKLKHFYHNTLTVQLRNETPCWVYVDTCNTYMPCSL